ncbi:MAG: LON peptidase substrate-binding domain-containing protein [Pseudomonadota bacterium]
MQDTQELPLFPLGTVLFPGGVLPLRIFEPRYVDMVRHCMREQSGFGVVLIRAGSEARLDPQMAQPDVFEVGTVARIVDFNQADNGLLGIVAHGGEKFRIEDTYPQADHLLLGRVRLLEPEAPGELLPEHAPLVEVLRELSQHPMVQQLNIDIDFDEARAVSWRLADLLPIAPEIKQALLQIRWPKERLTEIRRIVDKLRG